MLEFNSKWTSGTPSLQSEQKTFKRIFQHQEQLGFQSCFHKQSKQLACKGKIKKEQFQFNNINKQVSNPKMLGMRIDHTRFQHQTNKNNSGHKKTKKE